MHAILAPQARVSDEWVRRMWMNSCRGAGSAVLAGLLPRARFTILPGLGHAAVIEDPAAVAALVSER